MATVEECCKVALGVGGQAADCDLDQLAGARELRIALLCYIISISETIPPDRVVDNIVMKTLANDLINGDNEFLFYPIDTKEKTLSHTFSWTCNEETNRKVFEETIAGQVTFRSARTFNVLQQWMCKEIAAIAKEAGEDGKWFITGIGGGLRLNDINGGTGEGTRDNNNTNIVISGSELFRSFVYIDAGTPALTQTLIDSITSTAV